MPRLASHKGAALLALQHWVERIAEREMVRITAKCALRRQGAADTIMGAARHG